MFTQDSRKDLPLLLRHMLKHQPGARRRGLLYKHAHARAFPQYPDALSRVVNPDLLFFLAEATGGSVLTPQDLNKGACMRACARVCVMCVI